MRLVRHGMIFEAMALDKKPGTLKDEESQWP